jgi:hypothetical protein
MSKMSATVAFAFFVVLISTVASFAQPAGSAAAGNVPITTIDPSGVGKCFQNSAATGGVHKRPKIGPATRLCWAPREFTDGPEV